jgi:hypothetical protein
MRWWAIHKRVDDMIRALEEEEANGRAVAV